MSAALPASAVCESTVRGKPKTPYVVSDLVNPFFSFKKSANELNVLDAFRRIEGVNG